MQPIQMWRATMEPILSPFWGVLRVRVATVGHLHFCNKVLSLLWANGPVWHNCCPPWDYILSYLKGFMKAYCENQCQNMNSRARIAPQQVKLQGLQLQCKRIRRECLGPLVRTPHIWLQCSAEETAGDRGKHFGVWIWKWPRHAAMSCCKIQEKTEDHGSACQLSPPRKTLRTTALKTARLSKTQNNPGDNIAACCSMVRHGVRMVILGLALVSWDVLRLAPCSRQQHCTAKITNLTRANA